MPDDAARTFEPDVRSEPDYWTARKVLNEPRPPVMQAKAGMTQFGYGGKRRVWAHCSACGVQKTVDLERIVASGHGDQPIARLKLRCECGGLGKAKMVWTNPPKWKEDHALPGKPRNGSFDFATGQRTGAWD